ncbi:peptidogalycan biosysnthesis protein [Streptomyces sp. NRRL F-2664]|uniref:peptidogalycan biosysnthesis protein n=1 Tax=Streptomyces sp. NRRL F-2664 TaxID=1463842 RepID=UPI0007C6E3FB|nr:peptidogalycan biosysnthesis protein [Streptomyces sp. NRRL F-2664]
MITTLVESVHAVPAAEWERLARPAGLYLSHRWLAGEEADPTADAAYALVRDDDGTLLAAAPLYVVHEEPNDAYRPAGLLPPPHEPRVIAGARRGYRNTPLTAPGLDAVRRGACLALLRDAARALADRNGTVHWWPYLTAQAAARLSPLYPGDPLHLEDDALIPLPGADFEAYVASLPSRRRVGVRRERREFGAAGLDVRHLALADCAEDAGILLAGHQQDHGHDGDGADAMTGLLKRQAASMGDAARVVAAYAGRHMVGFCLYYHYAATTWIRAVAVDRTRPAPHLYFNLMYYLPVEDAYAHGTRALHAGMTTVEAKRRRGAVISPLYALTDRPLPAAGAPSSSRGGGPCGEQSGSVPR